MKNNDYVFNVNDDNDDDYDDDDEADNDDDDDDDDDEEEEEEEEEDRDDGDDKDHSKLMMTMMKKLIIVKGSIAIVLFSPLEAKIFALGEWYSCRRLAVVPNSGVSTWGLRPYLA